MPRAKGSKSTKSSSGAAHRLPATALWVALFLAAPAPPAPAPGVLWQFVTGGRSFISAPAVGSDGTLYVASGDGVLYAIAPNGRRRWSLATGVTVGAVPPARPAVGPDGTTYWDLRGSIVAVSRTGQLRWVFLAAGSGSPALARGRILFMAPPYLYAIETSGPRAGRSAWRAAIGTGPQEPASPSPAVGPDGTAYVPAPDGSLYAIAPTGLRRWTFRVGVPLLFSPAVGLDGTVYLDAFARGALYALTPRGQVRWRLGIPAGSDLVRGPDGTVYAATHLLLAVSPRGRVLWRRVVDAVAPPAVVPGPLVVVPTLSPPALLAFGPSGTLRWRVSLSAAAVAAPARGPAGRLYSAGYSGVLTALAPGARGRARIIQGTVPAGQSVELAADNPPFTVRSGNVTWRVTLARTVERVSGHRVRVVFTPGVATPDPRSKLYRNARYADVAFLAVAPHDRRGLYVGTVGALGEYLSGGAGGADGGLYYSPDGASGWRRLDRGLPFTYEPRLRVPTFGLDSLTFDPARRGVLYVQTPTAYGSPGHDAGLYKSTDGGRQWHPAMRGLPLVPQGNPLIGAYRAFPPGTLLVDRARSSVLFLIAPTGFYRSADAAGHWQRVRGVAYGDPASVAVRIGGGGSVRVFTDRGVYASGDFGAHWRRAL